MPILKRINEVKVKKVNLIHEEDKRPIKGADLFPELYANIFLVAKKKSGKSMVISKIIKECAAKETICIFFCSTINKDDVWKAIQESCKKHGIPFIKHESLNNDGIDQLDLLVKHLQNEAKQNADDEDDEDDDEEQEGGLRHNKERIERLKCAIKGCDSDSDDDDEKKKKKAKKSKYRSPEYLIILDDLSNEMKAQSLVGLLKKNRHFKCKVICSTQYCNDIRPESWQQADYALIFKGQSEKKLQEIWKNCDIGVEFDEFQEIYEAATQKPYSFLYIDCRSGKFRSNFNLEFVLE